MQTAQSPIVVCCPKCGHVGSEDVPHQMAGKMPDKMPDGPEPQYTIGVFACGACGVNFYGATLSKDGLAQSNCFRNGRSWNPWDPVEYPATADYGERVQRIMQTISAYCDASLLVTGCAPRLDNAQLLEEVTESIRYNLQHLPKPIAKVSFGANQGQLMVEWLNGRE